MSERDGAGFSFLVKNCDPASSRTLRSDGTKSAYKVFRHHVFRTRDMIICSISSDTSTERGIIRNIIVELQGFVGTN